MNEFFSLIYFVRDKEENEETKAKNEAFIRKFLKENRRDVKWIGLLLLATNFEGICYVYFH